MLYAFSSSLVNILDIYATSNRLTNPTKADATRQDPQTSLLFQIHLLYTHPLLNSAKSLTPSPQLRPLNPKTHK